jgi:hypothetical protein
VSRETPLDFLQLEQRASSWDPERGYSSTRSNTDFPVRNGVYVGQRMGIEITLKLPSEDIQDTCNMMEADTFRVRIYDLMMGKKKIDLLTNRYKKTGTSFLLYTNYLISKE